MNRNAVARYQKQMSLKDATQRANADEEQRALNERIDAHVAKGTNRVEAMTLAIAEARASSTVSLKAAPSMIAIYNAATRSAAAEQRRLAKLARDAGATLAESVTLAHKHMTHALGDVAPAATAGSSPGTATARELVTKRREEEIETLIDRFVRENGMTRAQAGIQARIAIEKRDRSGSRFSGGSFSSGGR